MLGFGCISAFDDSSGVAEFDRSWRIDCEPGGNGPVDVVSPWLCACSSTEGGFEDAKGGDAFGGTAISAGISSTWPDSKISLEEDIGNRGIFCWCSTSSSEYAWLSAAHAIDPLRAATKHPGYSIFLIRRASSPIRTSIIRFWRATMIAGGSSSSGVLLRSMPPIQLHPLTFVLPNAGLSSGSK